MANVLGKTLITVKTNLREQADINRNNWEITYSGDFWGRCLHGSSLASVGLCLSRIMYQVFIPSTRPNDNLIPWGSHPRLDPLWSTENMLFIHDGCESDRLQKVKDKISYSPIALKSLKVCYYNISNQYNCCQCEKCLRTMMELRVCEVLDKATSFHKPLNLQLVKQLVIPESLHRHYYQIIDEATQRKDEKLVNAIKVALGKKLSIWRLIYQSRQIIPKSIRLMIRKLIKFYSSRHIN